MQRWERLLRCACKFYFCAGSPQFGSFSVFQVQLATSESCSNSFCFLFFFFCFRCTSAALATCIIGGRRFSEKQASFISEANEEKKRSSRCGLNYSFCVYFAAVRTSLSVNMFYCSGRAHGLSVCRSLEMPAPSQCISRKSSPYFWFFFFFKSCSLLIVTRASILPHFCSARN